MDSIPMHTAEVPDRPHVPLESTSRWQRRGPIIALLLLSPIISELLYGSIRVSTLFVLIPEILTWGCGALLIRETVRRWKKGWTSMLLLGIAIAVAEEWVIQQTSIAPLVGLAAHAYGRVWGVNWAYFLWAVGYESVWVVMLPVQLTELLFPARRDELWLRTRGFVIASIAFLLGCFMAWYGWTQRARVKIFHMPPYSPPPLYILGGLLAVALLILAAYVFPLPRTKTSVRVPSAWITTLIVTALAWAWADFVLFGFGDFPRVPYQAALGAGLAWCILTFVLVRRWVSSRDWSDAQRLAVVLGGVLGCCIAAFVNFKLGGARRIDWIGLTVFDTAAIVWLLLLRRRMIRASL